MDFPWYVVTGNITVNNFTNLWTHERGFIWRGYTHEHEMLPSAANYNRSGEKITNYRTENCHPLAEIKRVAEKINELNKLQKFPFEIPLFVRKVLFSSLYQTENTVFKEIHGGHFPDSSLAQAMSIVQHECGGTSLLDFSTNKYKALYFAVGKEEFFYKDSYIFGLNVPYFEAQKNHFTKELSNKTSKQFDILYPSYFMNDKIAHQEGVFLYQKFKIDDTGSIIEDSYKNIKNYFKSQFNAYKKKDNDSFQEISIDKFLQKTKCGNGQECELHIFYISLKVPANEKRRLKALLDSMGITENFIMGEVKKDEHKIEHCFTDGDGI